MIHVKWVVKRSNSLVFIDTVLSYFGIESWLYHEEVISDTKTGEVIEEVYVIEFDTYSHVVENLKRFMKLTVVGEYLM